MGLIHKYRSTQAVQGKLHACHRLNEILNIIIFDSVLQRVTREILGKYPLR